MRLTRIATSLFLALALFGVVACDTTPAEQGPEDTWDSFVEAVAENRSDDALNHLDLNRMSERMLAQDPQMQQMAEQFGGTEGIAEILEEQLRTAIEMGDFGIDAEGDQTLVAAEVTNVDVEGDAAVLTVQSDGEDGLVHMERIDGEWKIVMLE